VQSYIDDIIIKSTRKTDLLIDRTAMFDKLHRYNMKLDLEKCVFDVWTGKLLKSIILVQGVKVNPDKIKQILKMHPP
jgi:hypothetical protein